MLSKLSPWLPLFALAFYCALAKHLHIPCPLRLFAGSDCPTCGVTRGIQFVLHGNISAALAANPLSLLVVIIVLRSVAIKHNVGGGWLNHQLLEFGLLGGFFATGLVAYAS